MLFCLPSTVGGGFDEFTTEAARHAVPRTIVGIIVAALRLCLLPLGVVDQTVVVEELHQGVGPFVLRNTSIANCKSLKT